MNSVLISKLKITLLALGLDATATPTWAATDITFCDEINQPGSYRVTQDLSCQSCPQCLLIDASNVTIDLQGHTISGDGSSSNSGIAVPQNSSLSNIEVRNGTVMSFGTGIDLSGTRGARVERVRVFDNQDNGISVGSNSVVASNIVNGMGRGIVVNEGAAGSLIVDNVVSGNFILGVVVKTLGSTIRGNVVTRNTNGIDVLCPSLLSGNTIVNNTLNSDLLLQGSGCVLRDNLTGGVR